MTEPEYPDFGETLEQAHRSVDALIAGDPEPQKRLWSRADDVTLANPFGGFARGWASVEAAMDRAATKVRGQNCEFEEVARLTGSDVAYVFEIERFEDKLSGLDGDGVVALRVTMIFRLEEGGWKLVHRQADPLVTPQPPSQPVDEVRGAQ